MIVIQLPFNDIIVDKKVLKKFKLLKIKDNYEYKQAKKIGIKIVKSYHSLLIPKKQMKQDSYVINDHVIKRMVREFKITYRKEIDIIVKLNNNPIDIVCREIIRRK